MATDLTCLRNIANELTKDLEDHIVDVNSKIEYYKNFYKNFGVPEEKIFISGIVSAKKIAELCENVEYLSIQIAKNSDDNDNFHDFTFIISQSDKEAKIIPDDSHSGLKLTPLLSFNESFNFKPKYLDSTCCRRPPGT